MKRTSYKPQISKSNIRIFFAILILASTLFLGIGYAQIAGIDLTIDGSAAAKRQVGLVITDVHYVSGVGVTPANSHINSFYQSVLDSSIELGEAGSSITYEVTIMNTTDIKKAFDEIVYTSEFYDNPDIEVVLTGLAHDDVINPGASKTFQITFQYKNTTNNPELNSCINFSFKDAEPKRHFALAPQCHYSGSLGTITGEGCEEFADDYYLDTGVALFSQENYLEDFSVSFDIEHYVVGEQQAGMDNQNTLMNAKLEVESRGYPGFVFRRNTNNQNLELTSGAKTAGPKGSRVSVTLPNNTHHVQIVRINHIMYYSADGGPFILFQDTTLFNDPFDTTVTFGASIKGDGTPFRYFTGDISNIVVDVGPIDSSTYYSLVFNANGGNTTTSYYLTTGQSAPSVPNVSRGGYYFAGWFDAATGGNQVTPSTSPGVDTTYYAHWKKSVNSASFQPTQLNLVVGETGTFTVTNAATIEETWTYSSTNNNIITVDSDGVVTAVGAGTANVRLRGAISNQTKDLKVTVTEPEPEPDPEPEPEP